MRNRLSRILVVVASSVGLVGFSFLDDVARRVEKGNRLFDQAEFEAALEAYREAQIDRPDAPELHYNVGDALYKQGAIDEAMAAFQKAVETGDTQLGSKAYYNLGNALYRQQAFDKAVGAYEKSLELDPSDRDAKVNLEMALEKMKEQEKQKKQDQQNQDDQGKNDEEEEAQKQDQSQNEDQKDQKEGQDNQDSSNSGQQEQDDPQRQPQNQEGQENSEQQQQPGKLSPEEAERLLDAMKDRESDSQKRRRVRLQGERYRGKPW